MAPSKAEGLVDQMLTKGPQSYVDKRVAQMGNNAVQEMLRQNLKGSTTEQHEDGTQSKNYGGCVALTFHIRPGKDTAEILDILKDAGVKASFFVGNEDINTDEARQALQRMKDEGHIVGAADKQTAKDENKPKSDTSLSDFQGKEHPSFGDLENGTEDYPVSQTEQATRTTNVDSDALLRSPPPWSVPWVDSSETLADVEDRKAYSNAKGVVSKLNETQGGVISIRDKDNTHPSLMAKSVRSLLHKLKDSGFIVTNLDDEVAFPELNQRAAAVNRDPYLRKFLIDEFQTIVDNQVVTNDDSASRLRYQLEEACHGKSLAIEVMEDVQDAIEIEEYHADLSLDVWAKDVDFDSAPVWSTAAKDSFEVFREAIDAVADARMLVDHAPNQSDRVKQEERK